MFKPNYSVCHRINEKLEDNGGAWIGLTKPESYGNCDDNCRRQGWEWADGTAYDYTRYTWVSGEPKMGEFCGLLHQSGIQASVCEQKFAYICEKGNQSIIVSSLTNIAIVDLHV